MRKDRYRSPSPKLSSAPGVPDGYHDIIECACAVFDSDSNGCLVTSVGSRFGRHWASAGIVRRFSCLTIRPTPLLTEIRNISIEPTLSFSIVAGIRDCHSSLLDDVLAERIKTVVSAADSARALPILPPDGEGHVVEFCRLRLLQGATEVANGLRFQRGSSPFNNRFVSGFGGRLSLSLSLSRRGKAGDQNAPIGGRFDNSTPAQVEKVHVRTARTMPMLPAVKLGSQENIRRPRRTDARCTSVMAPGV